MGSTLSAAHDKDEREFHASEPYRAMERNREEYKRMEADIPDLPVVKLTVGELNFVNEEVSDYLYNRWVDYESAEIKFYTTERNMRLVSIIAKCR